MPDHSLAIPRRLDREIECRASSWMQILELTERLACLAPPEAR